MPRAESIRGVTFTTWKKRVAASAEKKLALGDVMDEDDPYECHKLMEPAWRAGQTPAAFVREVFAEDFCGQEYERELHRESLRNQ